MSDDTQDNAGGQDELGAYATERRALMKRMAATAFAVPVTLAVLNVKPAAASEPN